ncbi:hypothetical protein [Erwinia sp. S63]|uniref:hypothetical protein n=1 Tax=Erwinia sp. S63 TaxID=2769341 RepID=UPI00190D0C16|nr:hypothetical protein [Erwinia sp. S63]
MNKFSKFSDKNVGFTETERKLSEICSKTFLKLWTWTSLYNDEGIKKNGKGNEICDLLVYFSNTVIIFSDKHVTYTEDSAKNIPEDDGTSVAWKRWKRRAIHSSVKQIEGAESWIRTHYDRIYFTEKCHESERFPFIHSENISKLKIFRIAVANGSPLPLFLGAGIGDAINTGVRDRHDNYVHVFDGQTIEALTQELSTVNEFVKYLEEKERIEKEGFFLKYERVSELDLLATFLLSPSISRGAGLYVKEDKFKIESYDELNSASDYLNGKEEDKVSIIFDDMIESISAQFIKGTVICTGYSQFEANQNVLEILCNFDRLSRRELSKSIVAKFKETSGRAISSRSMLLGEDDQSYTKNSIFAVVIFPKAVCKGMTRLEYEKERRLIAQAYATYYQLKIDKERDIVVVVFDNILETPGSWATNYKSFMGRVYKKDFSLVYRGKTSIVDEDLSLLHNMQQKWGILKSSPVRMFYDRAYQFHD